MKFNLSLIFSLLICIAVCLPSCKKTEGCNDSFANNAGDFDSDCDNCCTYDADNFYSDYLGNLRFASFGAFLDADSVIFSISPGVTTPDIVNIQITTETGIIPAEATVDGDSIFISAFVPDFEIPMFGTSDVSLEGGGRLDTATDSLSATMLLIAVTLDSLTDQFTFKGAKI